MRNKEEARRIIKVEEIMHPAVTVTRDATEKEAFEVLLEHRVSSVPVVDEEGFLVGLISDRRLLDSVIPDYLKILADASFLSETEAKWVDYRGEAADKPVSEVMIGEVSSAEVGTNEVVAAHQMAHEGVSSVVVTDEGKVVGILYRLDLYAAIIGAMKDEGEGR